MIDWSQVYLVVAIPSARGIQPECVQSLFQIRDAVMQKGGRCDFTSSRVPGMPLARGALFVQGIACAECSHFLAFDDDLQIPGEAIVRMIDADVPVIGAAYRIKHQDKRVQFVALFSPEQVNQEPVNGTVAVQRLGGGLILYKRDVLVRLLQEYGAFQWGGIKGLNAPLEYTDSDGTYLTEDYATCDRWRRLGGEVRLLLDVTTTHIGAGGAPYAGNFLHLWQNRHALLPDVLAPYNTLVLDKNITTVSLPAAAE